MTRKRLKSQIPWKFLGISWKMLTVFVCTLLFSVSASAFAQQERVTFSFSDVTVREVLNEIQKQTALSFIYNTEQAEDVRKLSIKAENESVSSVLDRMLVNTGLAWKIQGDMIY